MITTKMFDFYGLEFVSRPLVPSMVSASVVNGFPGNCFRRVLRRETTSCRKTHIISGASSSVAALHVKGSSFKSSTKSSSDLSSKNYSDQVKEIDEDGGPPRWFSPAECGRRSTGSPLLLFLPGIDGDGHGLMLQHERLGEIFDIRCLHIPVMDRTPFPELVKLVQHTVRTEHDRAAKTPIYLVGESFGASLALIVAAHNPHIDLVLILANPATSLSKSLLQSVVPFSDMIHKHLNAGQFQAPGFALLNSFSYLSFSLGMNAGQFQAPAETVLWKLRMIYEMQSYLDSHLHAVKAQTLILNSGKDMLLWNNTESERLSRMLKRCDVRSFMDNRNPLFLDETFDLVITIKRVSYYRRGASVDYISDFFPPTPYEVEMMLEQFRWLDMAVEPVIISTKDSGEVVRDLSGIPSEGPVLLVGNHMLMVMDAILLIFGFWNKENLMIRAMAHPSFFQRLNNGGKLPDLSLFDVFRLSGAFPVSPTNLYKALSMKSHVLLFPGGLREVLHHKGEEHKMFWPAKQEFVRMAARFGATIVPFGGVGEDDVVQLLLDSNDQMKFPPLKAFIEELTGEAVRLGSDAEGEIGNQIFYYPVLLPKLPGRVYFRFGKPISMEGREDVLTDKEKANEMYLEIQNEVQKCIDYLKENREKDPYRNLLARLAYQGFNGFDSQVPTFDI
ncbi:hypothetical protein ACP275_04G170000 [Erythranthe tilingii]